MSVGRQSVKLGSLCSHRSQAECGGVCGWCNTGGTGHCYLGDSAGPLCASVPLPANGIGTDIWQCAGSWVPPPPTPSPTDAALTCPQHESYFGSSSWSVEQGHGCGVSSRYCAQVYQSSNPTYGELTSEICATSITNMLCAKWSGAAGPHGCRITKDLMGSPIQASKQFVLRCFSTSQSSSTPAAIRNNLANALPCPSLEPTGAPTAPTHVPTAAPTAPTPPPSLHPTWHPTPPTRAPSTYPTQLECSTMVSTDATRWKAVGASSRCTSQWCIQAYAPGVALPYAKVAQSCALLTAPKSACKELAGQSFTTCNMYDYMCKTFDNTADGCVIPTSVLTMGGSPITLRCTSEDPGGHVHPFQAYAFLRGDSSSVQTVKQVSDPLQGRPPCVAKSALSAATGIPCSVWYIWAYVLAITLLLAVEVVPRVMKGSRWTRCSECTMCCCCLCCGALSEDTYQSVQRWLYDTSEAHDEDDNHDDLGDAPGEQSDAADSNGPFLQEENLLCKCAKFIARNHPLAHVWHHRHNATRLLEQICIILLAFVCILPAEVQHKIYGHAETWNQMVCGLSDGFFPLLQAATNFCLWERGFGALCQLIRRGTNRGTCLGISALVLLALLNIWNCYMTFYFMSVGVPIGTILLACFKVILLAFFVIDVVLLTGVFFITQCAMARTGRYADPQECPTSPTSENHGASTMELSSLAQDDSSDGLHSELGDAMQPCQSQPPEVPATSQGKTYHPIGHESPRSMCHVVEEETDTKQEVHVMLEADDPAATDGQDPPPYSFNVSRETASSPTGIHSKMATLKQLLDDNLVTHEEYEAKKAALLEAL